MTCTKSREMLILAIACSSLAVGQQPTVPKTTSETKPQEQVSESAVSLSARAVRKDGATHLAIEWNGQKHPAILAVAITSANGFGQRVLWPGEQELRGIVLFRSIGEEGSATIEFADAAAFEVFGKQTLRVKIYVAKEIAVRVYENSGSKRVGDLQSTTSIRPEDCPAAFQVISPSNSSWTKAFHGVKPMEFDVSERGHATPFIDDCHIRESLKLKITIGDDQMQP